MSGYQDKQRSESVQNVNQPIGTWKRKLNKREKIFVDIFFKDRPFEIPGYFNLDHPLYKRYYPDFYDIERDTYIEVVGSRQAYHFNKNKYRVFDQQYSDIKFEIRHYKGNIFNSCFKQGQYQVARNRNIKPIGCQEGKMNNLKKIREEKGMTQIELAFKSEVSTSTISLIENSEFYVPNKSTLKALAKALNCKAEDLKK